MPQKPEIKRDQDGRYTRTDAQFSNADRIACAVHAALHSAGKPLSKGPQDKINLGTTAVAFAQDGIYFAFNAISTSPMAYKGFKASAAEIESIPLHFELEKSEICGTGKPVPKDRDSSKYVLQPRPARVNIRESELTANMALLRQDRTISKVRIVPTSLALPYRTVALEYIQGSDHELLTYKLRVSGQTKGEALKYHPKTILRDILKVLSEDDPLLSLKGIYWILSQADPKCHAEMQLIRALGDAGKSIREIGVSKPCCQLCAQHLDGLRIPYSAWSQVTNPGRDEDWWAEPRRISALRIEPV
jgi:hypothetical protein